MTHLDLFSGIGGFALAAKWNNVETIAFAEIEPYACKVLNRHWPKVPNFGNVRNVRGVSAWLVTGGFPCQPFSCAGKRKGQSDDRAIWPEMLRVIKDARPNWVLAENVPELDGMGLDDVLSDLEAIGYKTAPPLEIPACSVNAPHVRQRLWIVAHSEHMRCDKRKPGNARSKESPWSEYRMEHHRRARLLPTPRVCRMADGIPNRLDRIRATGNAIVPQIAAHLIRWMLEIEERE